MPYANLSIYLSTLYVDVGKSSLLLQFLEKRFNPTHRMTIGVEYGLKPTTIKGKDIGIEIWDTVGR